MLRAGNILRLVLFFQVSWDFDDFLKDLAYFKGKVTDFSVCNMSFVSEVRIPKVCTSSMTNCNFSNGNMQHLEAIQKLHVQNLERIWPPTLLTIVITVCSDGLWPSKFLALKKYTFLIAEFIYKSRGILGFVPCNHSQNHLWNFAKSNCIFHF